MKKIVCIHQPDFLPYLGFFDRLLNSDIFVMLNDVQFLRRGWHHRDKIKTSQGVQWLTVPVKKKGQYRQLIKDAKIDYQTHWKQKHLATIKFNYIKAPYFNTYFGDLQRIYDKTFEFLIDFNVELLQWILDIMQHSAQIVFASSLGVKSTRTLRLVEIVERLGGTTYFSGVGAKAYLEEHLFAERNIRLIWQDFKHPVYPQLYGEFVPNLSVLDCLLNCGEQCRNLLSHNYVNRKKGDV